MRCWSCFAPQGHDLTKEMFLTPPLRRDDEPELKIIDVFICKLRKSFRWPAAATIISRTSGGRGSPSRSEEVETARSPDEFESGANRGGARSDAGAFFRFPNIDVGSLRFKTLRYYPAMSNVADHTLELISVSTRTSRT